MKNYDYALNDRFVLFAGLHDSATYQAALKTTSWQVPKKPVKLFATTVGSILLSLFGLESDGFFKNL